MGWWPRHRVDGRPGALRYEERSGKGRRYRRGRRADRGTADGWGMRGKHAGDVASEAALLARATGRPVKVHWSRSEELRWGTVRPMALIDVVAGLGQDGELVTWDFLNINAGAQALALPYRTRTSRLRYQPARSPLRQGPYRALAANANNFARESVIDELAVLSGEDPLEFRLARLNDAR